jgi:ABC-type Fe3+ transport system permease subunit
MLRRATARVATSIWGLVLPAPLLALVATVILDTGPGPDSLVRVSLFPLVLTAYDTLTWASLGNSLALAATVACGSLICGVSLGRVFSRWHFWGRPLFFALLLAPAVIPPSFTSLGLLGLFDPSGPRVWRSLARVVFAPEVADRGWPWLVWTWAALSQGVALVVFTTSSVLRLLDPDREDAARLAGASPRRIWWSLTWPALRPSVAAVISLIFMLTLADPGPPLILGLRRSLGFQLVFSSIRPDPFPRIAALGVVILSVALAWHKLVSWWGRAGMVPDLFASGTRDRQRPSALDAAWPRSAAFGVVLLFCSLLAWLPVLGLATMSLARLGDSDNSHPLVRLGVLDLARRLTEDPAPQLLAHTLLLGLGVGLVLWTLASWRPRDPFGPPARKWKSVGAFVTSSVPPLVMGVSVLSFSRLAGLAALWLEGRLEWPRAAAAIELMGRTLDPCAAPGLALYLGVCLAQIPTKLLTRRSQPGRGEPVSHRIDQAVLSGARRHRARALGLRGSASIPARSIVLWSVLAATGIAPAILLAPTMESRPVGPGIVILADGPGESRAQAAALALTTIVVNLAALGWFRVGLGAGAGRYRSSGGMAEELV